VSSNTDRQSRTAMPSPNARMAQEDGTPTQEWYRFTSDLYNYSGVSREQYQQYERVFCPPTGMIAGSSAPTVAVIGSTSIRAYRFSNSGGESLHGSLCLPKNQDPQTSIYPYAQFVTATAADGNVEWTLSFAASGVGVAISATTQTITQAILATDATNQMYRIVSSSSVSCSGVDPFFSVPFSITRASSTYTGNVWLVDFGFVAQCSLPGVEDI